MNKEETIMEVGGMLSILIGFFANDIRTMLLGVFSLISAQLWVLTDSQTKK